VICLTLLLLSGLRIFNYHPALYWGNTATEAFPPWVSIGSQIDPSSGQPVGVTQIAGLSFISTGVLGVSYDSERGMGPARVPGLAERCRASLALPWRATGIS